MSRELLGFDFNGFVEPPPSRGCTTIKHASTAPCLINIVDPCNWPYIQMPVCLPGPETFIKIRRELRLMFFVMSAISVGPYESFLCWSGSLCIAFMFCALFLLAA